MRRTVVDPRFAATLASLLTTSGMSQVTVAANANMSRSYLSQIINGQRMPSEQVARALDAVLSADGKLANLVALTGRADDLDQMAGAAANPRHVSAETIASLSRVLNAQRHLDDMMGSAALIGPVLAQMDPIGTMVVEAVGPTRPRLLYVAGQWAQFAGWLHTSAGQWAEARRWFGRALEWAAECGDADMTATVLSYEGHVSWLTCQWGPTVGLSQAAMRDPAVYPGQRAYDALQAARGHAALGDLDSAERMLALGGELAEWSDRWVGEIPPWQYYRQPWFWSLERGLAHRYMARWVPKYAATAVMELRAGLDGMPEQIRGADWAAEYMVHMAAAYISADATVTAREVLDKARQVALSTKSTRVLRMVAGQERRLKQLDA